MGTEAVIRAFCINALAINATAGVLTLIYILREKEMKENQQSVAPHTLNQT